MARKGFPFLAKEGVREGFLCIALSGMNTRHDLGAMLAAATLLLLCVSYLTQCSATSHRSDTIVVATPAAIPPAEARDEEELEREGKGEHKPTSIRDIADEEQKEERAKIKAIAIALQTASTDPEFRRAYGLPQ